MAYSVIFQCMYVLCKDQSSVFGMFITLLIYHFFVVRPFKILSSSYFKTYNVVNCSHPTMHYNTLTYFFFLTITL